MSIDFRQDSRALLDGGSWQGIAQRCGWLTLFLALSGFASDAGVVRLGPTATPHVKVGEESRPVLPRRVEQTFPVTLHGGCVFHVGVANLGNRDALTFEVAFRRSGQRFESAVTRSVAPGWAWTDLTASITADGPVDAVRLRIAGRFPRDGLWARPLLTCPHERESRPTNVLLISLDTLRADRLGAYGNARQLTPRLDRLAREGTVFTRAYSHYPNTLVSHASLFTALFPREHGLIGGVQRRSEPAQGKLRAGQETLASALAERGYATAAFTENAFVGSLFGFDRGFDRYSDGPAGQEFAGGAQQTFRRAAEWLEQRPAAPFFLFVHTYQVHTPYSPPPEGLEQLRAWQPDHAGAYEQTFHELGTLAYNHGSLEISAKDMARVAGLYDAEVWSLDRELATFLDALQAAGVLDSTLVVVLSDHGEEFAEHRYMGHGETLHEQALHVPLIFWAPGLVPAGKRLDAPVGLVNAAPTIAELIGAGPILRGASGRSLAHWIRAGLSGRRGHVISELVESATACKPSERTAPLQTCRYDGVAIRDDAFTYIHSAASGVEQLFDRRVDAGETRDLSRERPQDVARYRALAAEYRRRTGSRARRPARVRIDSATQQGLRALGYVQ